MKKQQIIVTRIILLFLWVFGFAPWAFFSSCGGGTGSLYALGMEQPDLQCRAAVLFDVNTGALLFEKNGDLEIPPASMTKLMTLYILYNEIKAGNISKETRVPITENADFRNLPPRSSLMFLQEDQIVTIEELMLGLAIPSGNDAAIAVAEYLSGSVEAFVGRMNQEARELGLTSISFVDASGLSRDNRATALEYARFCLTYLQKHPEAIEIHSRTTFTYPLPPNIPEGDRAVHGPITQHNRNNLLEQVKWIDGLKTGYIDASGYNIALTGESNGRRLLAVLMGGPGESHQQGGFIRALDGIKLLTYGFYRFANTYPAFELPEKIKVWQGKEPVVEISRPEIQQITLPREDVEALTSKIEFYTITAPVSAGDIVGRVIITLRGRQLTSYPVLAAADVETGPWYIRLADAIPLFFTTLGND